MKVKELIEKLKSVDPDLEVVITDGYDAKCYEANAQSDILVAPFVNDDGVTVCDLGIGGMSVEL